MAALTGNSVGSSYQSLLKTADNAAIDATLKNMTDGLGNATPLSMGTNTIQLQADTIELIEPTGGTNLIQITPTNVYFEGAVDFTNASVTGIGGGTPGVADGTGTNSMATTLTNLPATATGSSSIAFGRNAKATNDSAISIGNYAAYTAGSGSKAIAIGSENIANGSQAIVMGWLTEGRASKSIAMGTNAKSRAEKCITIGAGAIVDDSIRVNTVVVGADAKAAQYSTALGANAYAVGDYAISIGDANTFATGAIAIGDQAQSFTNGAAVIGRNLTAVSWQDSTTVNQLAFANVANLNFVDQAAAVAGGVPTGGLYHTDGTVKIVY